MQDTVSDLDPAVRACSLLKEWIAASDACPLHAAKVQARTLHHPRPEKAIIIELGSTMRGVGPGGSNPLAPTKPTDLTTELELLGQCRVVPLASTIFGASPK